MRDDGPKNYIYKTENDPDVLTEFTIAIVSVIVIIAFSIALLQYTNKKFRRDYGKDLEKGEQLQESCITDEFKAQLHQIDSEKARIKQLKSIIKQKSCAGCEENISPVKGKTVMNNLAYNASKLARQQRQIDTMNQSMKINGDMRMTDIEYGNLSKSQIPRQKSKRKNRASTSSRADSFK